MSPARYDACASERAFKHRLHKDGAQQVVRSPAQNVVIAHAHQLIGRDIRRRRRLVVDLPVELSLRVLGHQCFARSSSASGSAIRARGVSSVVL